MRKHGKRPKKKMRKYKMRLPYKEVSYDNLFLHIEMKNLLMEGSIEFNIFNNPIGFPPVLTDMPLFRIIVPRPCNIPCSVILLCFGDKFTFKITKGFVFHVKNTVFGRKKEGWFAYIFRIPHSGIVCQYVLNLLMQQCFKFIIIYGVLLLAFL